MNRIVPVFCLALMLLFSSCSDEDSGTYCAISSSQLAHAAPAHRTDRERHMQQVDTTIRMGQWEFYLPDFSWFYSCSWGAICGGVITVDMPLLFLPAMPDSAGQLSFDNEEFRDTLRPDRYCYNRTPRAFPNGTDTIHHTIYNSGTLPVRIDSLVAEGACTKAFCSPLVLLPGDSVTIHFTHECIYREWAVCLLKLYYVNTEYYPATGRIENPVRESITYYLNYETLW